VEESNKWSNLAVMMGFILDTDFFAFWFSGTDHTEPEFKIFSAVI
jgi:hypothetical protein